MGAGESVHRAVAHPCSVKETEPVAYARIQTFTSLLSSLSSPSLPVFLSSCPFSSLLVPPFNPAKGSGGAL